MAMPSPSPRRGLNFVFPAFAAALLLAGCASTGGLAPQGQPVNADSLASARSLAAAEPDDAAFPARDWCTALADRQLDPLTGEALRDSPPLAAAHARGRQAQAQDGLANAARKPMLGARVRATAVQLPATVAPA